MSIAKSQVLQQASEDYGMICLSCLKYEAYILYSIKIVKDNHTGDVQLYNTAANGDHYEVLEKSEHKNFIDKGWRYGVYVISLSNYRLKLDRIEHKIREEISGKSNIRYIKILKLQREDVLKRFSKVNQKLNQF